LLAVVVVVLVTVVVVELVDIGHLLAVNLQEEVRLLNPH
jgi:hypothetical protein